MTKIFLSTLAVAALVSGSAVAADLPVKAPAAAARHCAADQFRGFYVGINGGGINWTANRTDLDEVLVDTATYVQKKWGGVVGGQIGYNAGTCNTVWGIELDGDWVSARQTTQLIPNASPLLNLNIASRFDALLTARGRVGVAVDNLLFYTTGGIAVGHFKTTYTNQFFGIPPAVPGFIFTAETNEWRWGLVAGIGAEWAWSDRVTIRSEVLYVDFVDRSQRFLFAPPATFATFTESDSAWIARLGLNIKFGGPVTASY